MEPHVDSVTGPAAHNVGRHFAPDVEMVYANEPPHCTCAGLTTAPPVGTFEGDFDGVLEGADVVAATFVGALEGAWEGTFEGLWDGALEGLLEGLFVGDDVTAWGPAVGGASQVTVSTADPVLDAQAPTSRVTQPCTLAVHCDFRFS